MCWALGRFLYRSNRARLDRAIGVEACEGGKGRRLGAPQKALGERCWPRPGLVVVIELLQLNFVAASLHHAWGVSCGVPSGGRPGRRRQLPLCRRELARAGREWHMATRRLLASTNEVVHTADALVECEGASVLAGGVVCARSVRERVDVPSVEGAEREGQKAGCAE